MLRQELFKQIANARVVVDDEQVRGVIVRHSQRLSHVAGLHTLSGTGLLAALRQIVYLGPQFGIHHRFQETLHSLAVTRLRFL